MQVQTPSDRATTSSQTPSYALSADAVASQLDVDKLERVWFVKEPFTVAPLYGFDGIAHTYFVFDFQDQDPVVISVEARRQHGLAYDVVRGAFNEYELTNIWGTVRVAFDLVRRRVSVIAAGPDGVTPQVIADLVAAPACRFVGAHHRTACQDSGILR